MRVLAIHSKYRQLGGEDISFETECRLLKGQNHEVKTYLVYSSEIAATSPLNQARAAIKGTRKIEMGLFRALIDSDPDVIYLNNWFPWLSPFIGPMADRAPILVAVRNYRLWCINGLLKRNGSDCRLCLDKKNSAGVIHGCYEGIARSLVAAASVKKAASALRPRATVHFAAISPFVEQFLLGEGISRDRVHLKPNAVDPEPAQGPGGDSVLFVGRLEPEKGFATFMEAAGRAGIRPIIVGAGSMSELASHADYRGQLSHQETMRLMAASRVTVVPSEWDEPFGRVAAESLACGTPVIVSNRGGLATIADPSCSMVVPPGDPDRLTSALLSATNGLYWSGPARAASRECFQARYSGAPVAAALIQALERTRASRPTDAHEGDFGPREPLADA